MKCVILAGGLGSRLSEETDLRPKPMVDIGGKPILWHIMKVYAAHSVTDFVVCLGYRGYFIKEYFANYYLYNTDVTFGLGENSVEYHRNASVSEDWRVTLIDTGAETMTGGRLKRVRQYLSDETFCMTYGDGLSDVDIGAAIAFHRTHGRAATVAGVSQPGRFGDLDLDGDRVLGFREKAANDDMRINGGFFVLEPRALDVIDGDETSWERQPLERLTAADELRCFRHDGFWRPMDTLREKRELEALWSAGEAPWKVW